MTADVGLILGHDRRGDAVRIRLSRAPHILVAGMTGSGKSVVVHALITQLLTQVAPADVALVLIDPKRVEFAPYRGVPHLPIDPLSGAGEIASVLEWAVAEMHSRFAAMERSGWRDVAPAQWPRLVVVIDELANLMLADRKRFERPIVELASMGRAAGVHLLLATQRPSADVLTGLIRANVPTRICLPVINRSESRIVLDAPGGETLLGAGSMLIRRPGQRELIGARGDFIPDEHIRIVAARARGWAAAA